jgi:hypothetical protein
MNSRNNNRNLPKTRNKLEGVKIFIRYYFHFEKWQRLSSANKY